MQIGGKRRRIPIHWKRPLVGVILNDLYTTIEKTLRPTEEKQGWDKRVMMG